MFRNSVKNNKYIATIDKNDYNKLVHISRLMSIKGFNVKKHSIVRSKSANYDAKKINPNSFEYFFIVGLKITIQIKDLNSKSIS